MIALKLVHRRVVELMRANQWDQAEKVARRYVRFFRRRWWAWLFLDQVLGDHPERTFEDRRKALETAFGIMPHEAQVADRLAGICLFEFYRTSDPEPSERADAVMREHESLLGPSVSTHVWWSERAQDRNQMDAALEHIAKARAIAESHRNPLSLFQIGAGLSSIPGHLEPAVELMQEGAAGLKEPFAPMQLAVILQENDDSVRAEKWRQIAMARVWKGATEAERAVFEQGMHESNRLSDLYRSRAS